MELQSSPSALDIHLQASNIDAHMEPYSEVQIFKLWALWLPKVKTTLSHSFAPDYAVQHCILVLEMSCESYVCVLNLILQWTLIEFYIHKNISEFCALDIRSTCDKEHKLMIRLTGLPKNITSESSNYMIRSDALIQIIISASQNNHKCFLKSNQHSVL